MMKQSNDGSVDLNNHTGVYERTTGRIFDLYLNDVIQSPKDYITWNQLIRSAGEQDIIHIHINCYGGDVMTTIQLLRSIAECNGTVVASIEGACMSAATFIFLAADMCEISDHSQFLIHNYSAGNWGKGNELIAKALAEHAWANRLLNTIYEGFLTKQEIKEVIEGKDFWLDAPEVAKRLEKRNAASKKGTRNAAKRKLSAKRIYQERNSI